MFQIRDDAPYFTFHYDVVFSTYLSNKLAQMSNNWNSVSRTLRVKNPRRRNLGLRNKWEIPRSDVHSVEKCIFNCHNHRGHDAVLLKRKINFKMALGDTCWTRTQNTVLALTQRNQIDLSTHTFYNIFRVKIVKQIMMRKIPGSPSERPETSKFFNRGCCSHYERM